MTTPQLISLLVLATVAGVLIWGRARAEIVALCGAAVLLGTGTIRPIDAQAAFASPAIITLASLFVIAYAIELSGLLDLMVRQAERLCDLFGVTGLWAMVGLSGAASAFLNNTPIVVLVAPIIQNVARSMGLSAKRFLLPLSYATILGGACTLIGTSTNLLVNDMARNAGQPTFGMFEITPVALIVALAGGIYLFFYAHRALERTEDAPGTALVPTRAARAIGDRPEVFPLDVSLKPVKAAVSLGVFVAVVTVAALGLLPIASAAFSGAVLLVLVGVISADEAYRGFRPEILFLIAGMVVIGLSLEVTGLARLISNGMVAVARPIGPLFALAVLYAVTLILTEFLSNAAVAVLITPIAVSLAHSLGVNPRPFLVCVMLAASAAFATPFGYQTNVLVYQLGGYNYMDFVRVGVPLNLLTWLVGVAVVPLFFPF